MNAKQARLLSDPKTAKEYQNVMDAIQEAVKSEKVNVRVPYHVSKQISDCLEEMGYEVYCDQFATLSHSETEIRW